MSNPNKNPVTNPLSASDLLRIVQEGYSGDISLAQLAAIFGGGGAFGIKSVGVLATQGAATTVTGTTAESSLWAGTVPANVMSANGGALRLTFRNTSNGSTAKTINVRFGGQLLWSFPMANVTVESGIVINNAGATNIQHSTATSRSFTYGGTGSPAGAGTVDTTQPQLLTVTTTNGLTSDSVSLDNLLLELLNQ